MPTEVNALFQAPSASLVFVILHYRQGSRVCTVSPFDLRWYRTNLTHGLKTVVGSSELNAPSSTFLGFSFELRSLPGFVELVSMEMSGVQSVVQLVVTQATGCGKG